MNITDFLKSTSRNPHFILGSILFSTHALPQYSRNPAMLRLYGPTSTRNFCARYRKRVLGWALSAIIFTLSILLSGCQGVGIFSYVATTDKIESGLLPTGLGASKVLRIRNEYETSHYDYFSSGPTLYRRNTKDRNTNTTNPWETDGMQLPSGWTNIQSITASNDNLLLALAKINSSSMEVGLFYYNTDGFSQIEVEDDILKNDENQYKTILLYWPVPEALDGVFYVNVLSFTGQYGDDSTEFQGSSLYLLDDKPDGEEGVLANANKATGSWETKLKDSYISSMAANESPTYRFTTINPDENEGMLTDENGTQIENSPTVPSDALTWLPGDDGTQWSDGAFIMAGRESEDSNYPIYISTDGNQWTTLTSGYRFICFLDITGTEAGGDSDNLILAGTRNTGNTTTGSGYMEIVANTADPADWTIKTEKDSFTFAQTGTYIASDLSNDSIVGFSLLDSFVYASTDDDGVWITNADDEEKHAGTGLEWSRE